VAAGVETVQAMRYRARIALDQQLSHLGPRPVALVSHDVVIRELLAMLKRELGPTDWIGQRTACFNELVHDTGEWRCCRWTRNPAGDRLDGQPQTRRERAAGWSYRANRAHLDRQLYTATVGVAVCFSSSTAAFTAPSSGYLPGIVRAAGGNGLDMHQPTIIGRGPGYAGGGLVRWWR